MAVTSLLQLPLIDNTMTANVVRDLNALAQAVDSKAMAKDGGELNAKVVNVTDGIKTLTFSSAGDVAWFGTFTNTDFRIVTNNIDRGRVRADGVFSWLSRMITGRAGLQIGQNETASKNFYISSDEASDTDGAGLRIYNGNHGSGNRLFSVHREGHVLMGDQNKPNNGEGWSRVFDIKVPGNGGVHLRTGVVDSRIIVHDNGYYGGGAGMYMGTTSNHDTALIQGGARRLTLGTDGLIYAFTPRIRINAPAGADANLSLSPGNTSSSSYGVKEIISSANVNGGDGLLFRAHRPADNSYKDAVLYFQQAGGQILTDSHIVRTGRPPNQGEGFDGMIWLQY